MQTPDLQTEPSPVVLSRDVVQVIGRLEEAGYEAWAVGGCVRDSLLGRTPKDYDVASLCPPELVGTLFPHCIATGLAYGTVTVLTDTMPVEVTVFRKESEYSDSRHPDGVAPAESITADLSRRDFTMNAIAWHPLRGFCDPFSGRSDIEKKCVCAVGDPSVRFGEDALRILRCLRFASELDFAIDPRTSQAAFTLAPTLGKISIERVTAELSRLLCGHKPALAVPLIEAEGLCHIGMKPGGLTEADAGRLALIPPELPLRLAGLLSLYPNGAYTDILKALRLDNRTHRTTEALLVWLRLSLPSDSAGLKRAFSSLPPEHWEGLLALRSALFREDTQAMQELLLEAEGQPWNRTMLALSGNDLLELGFSGTQIGSVLSRLLEMVIEHPETNTRARLTQEAQKIK